MDVVALAKMSLRDHEGLRLEPYLCTSRKITIGYGRNLDDKGISHDEAELMLSHDIMDCLTDLRRFEYWIDLTPRRQAALIDLRFCVGPAGYRQFVKMAEALKVRDYGAAADQILDSKFAKQTGRRAIDLAQMMIEG
jgi:lysozyme